MFIDYMAAYDPIDRREQLRNSGILRKFMMCTIGETSCSQEQQRSCGRIDP